MPRSANATVDCLIAAWERLDIEAIAECFTEDAVWHNMPYAPISGKASIIAAVEKFLSGIAEVRFEIRNSGNIGTQLIWNERIDIFTKSDGSSMRLPVSGIFEIQGGFIKEWRDYFDGSAFAAG